MFASACFVLLSLATANGYFAPGWEKEHSGSQVWSVTCTDCARSLARLMEHVDILAHDESSIALHVSHSQMKKVATLLQNEELRYAVQVEDVADHLREHHEREQTSRMLSKVEESCTDTSCPRPLKNEYMTFQQMEWFLKELSTTYSSLVTLTSQGHSVEGRDLWLVRVAAPTNVGKQSKAVFVEGGAHAREWIGPATVLHLLNDQVVRCTTGQACEMEYYFMPTINPDGYVYSWTTNRLWRKNRSIPPNDSTNCSGTDLNRNWGYKFGFSGSSSSPCRQTYKGTGEFSEPETLATKHTIDNIATDPNKNVTLYMSYHSFSQLVLYPWCYEVSQDKEYTTKMENFAILYADALRKVHNFKYTPEQAASLYPAAGCSTDYTQTLPIAYSLTVELRSTSSFLLPADQIYPTFQENSAGFQTLLEYLSD